MRARYIIRGKRKDGTWLIGNYHYNKKTDIEEFSHIPEHCIFPQNTEFEELNYVTHYEVISKTLGQCTGIFAVKSYRGQTPDDSFVFEADILRNKKNGTVGSVEWVGGRWTIAGREYVYANLHSELAPNTLTLKSDWEIIGNVHDNPELLLDSEVIL